MELSKWFTAMCVVTMFATGLLQCFICCEHGTRSVSTARDCLTVMLSLKGKSITKQKPSLLRSKINFKEQNKDDELKNVGETILGLLWGNQLV